MLTPTSTLKLCHGCLGSMAAATSPFLDPGMDYTLNLHTLSIAPVPHQENRALSSGCNSQEELFSLASSSSLGFLTLSCLIFNCISESTNTASPRSPQLRHLNIMGLDHEGIALTNRPSNGFMM